MRIKKRWIGFALLAAGLLACAVPLAQWVSQNNAEDAVYRRIRQATHMSGEEQNTESGSRPPRGEDAAISEQSGADSKRIDFAALQAVNGDCVGWITIPGTAIDYPVVQAKGNEYLNRDFAGNKNRCGTIFVQGDVEAQNVTLYGHHLKHRDVMFGPLLRYKDKDFYEEHREIYFYTPEDSGGRYEVIAAFNTKAIEDIPYAQAVFAEGELESLIRAACGRGEQLVPEILPDEKIITLSTCDGSYGGSAGRFVVLAKKDTCLEVKE